MANLFIPEVFSDAINEKLGTTLKWGSVSVDATSMVPEIKNYGDTVHFPKIKRTAIITTPVKGTPMTPAELDMSDSTATIKYIASPFRVYDIDKAQIKGDVQNRVIEQISDAMAKQIDTDLATEADNTVFKTATAAVDSITSAELQLGFDNFGDNVDTDTFAAIVINPRLRSKFAGMTEFINTALTYQTNGNGIVKNGVIGHYFGVPVICTANGTYDSTKSECKTYIVKKDALSYVFQKNITYKEGYDPLLLATDISASSLYAVKLLDDTGIVVLRKTVV
ncbi:MAG: hypothetical protein LKK39_03075 [Oscillospiraceae bacterium]|jgi:hypothetical protein|nr:hypothetical protein [Oscillospiraceae bacterium]MCI2190574.1 hypothetical protein [Oscillospiraceae bacterium]